MHNLNTTGPETEVQTTNPTPEEIAAAKAIIAAGEFQLANKGSSEEVQGESANSYQDETDGQGKVTVEQLRTAFEAAMASEVYLGNPKKLDRLLEMLKIPMANEKDYNQFLNHARKDLLVKAAEAAAKSGETVVLPTDEQIATEAKKRLDAKLKREQEKAAKTK